MNKYQESLNYIIDKYIDMHYEGKPMNEDTEHALRLQELVDKADSFEWIPVYERLPEPISGNSESGFKFFNVYLVSIAGESYPRSALWDGRYFCDAMYRLLLDVEAWMPLPTPYKEKEK